MDCEQNLIRNFTLATIEVYPFRIIRAHWNVQLNTFLCGQTLFFYRLNYLKIKDAQTETAMKRTRVRQPTT